MTSQWQCIQKNIGTWQGSFTQFSPDGEQLKDTPSVLTLAETEPGKKMQLTLERSPLGGSTETTRREFTAPGPAPYVYFFESGAFSQGSSQWAAFGGFGAEMSIKLGDRRARFVIMYEGTSDGTSPIKYVTLIRETRTGGSQFTELDLTPAQIMGSWRGTSSVLSASMEPMTAGHSNWTLNHSALNCQDAFEREVDKAAEEEIKALLLTHHYDHSVLSLSRPILLEGELTYQLMPLPNGTYCLMPHTLKKDVEFRIEAGWLSSQKGRSQNTASAADRPQKAALKRSRLIRYYNSRSVWTHSALIEDHLEE
ncbi:MAG: DUF3598 family protein [Phormidesmis sp.]